MLTLDGDNLEQNLTLFQRLVTDGSLVLRRNAAPGAAAAAAPLPPAPVRLVLRPVWGDPSQRMGRFHIAAEELVRQLDDARRQMFIALDMSASMDGYYRDQRQAAAELVRAVQEAQLPPETCYIIFFDSRVMDTIDATAADALTRAQTARSGGGTAFDPPLQEIRRLHRAGHHADIFFMTDGQASGWQTAARSLQAELTPESHLQPLFFGQVPQQNTRGRGGYWGSYGANGNAQHYEALQAMRWNSDVRHVRNITELCQWIRDSVVALGDEFVGTVTMPDGTQLTASLFSNGETVTGVLATPVDEAVAQTLAGRTTITITGGREPLSMPIQIELDDTPMTNTEEVQSFAMRVASQMAELRDTIQNAYRGDAEAQRRLVVTVEALRRERQRLKVPDSNPFVQQLQQAHDEAQRIIRVAASQGAQTSAAAFEVQGDRNALRQLMAVATWQSTSEHGKARKEKRAVRAQQRVNELLLRHRDAVRNDVQEIQTLMARITTELPPRRTVVGTEDAPVRMIAYPHRMPSAEHVFVTVDGNPVVATATPVDDGLSWLITLKTPAVGTVVATWQILDTPEDAVTFDNQGWTLPVMVVAGPGVNFTTDQIVNGADPLVTAAISNPSSARGVIQTVMSIESFAECLRQGTQLFRSSMTGLVVVPFRPHSRSETAAQLLRRVAPLIAMQIICGVNTRPSASGLNVYPAIAFGVLTSDDITAESLAAALALGQYYHAMGSHTHRTVGDQRMTMTTWATQHAMEWNGIVLSNAEGGDGALPNVAVAMTAPVFAVLPITSGAGVTRRCPAALFETARLGLAHELQQQQRPNEWVRGTRESIVGPLGLETVLETTADTIAPGELLDRIAPHLWAMARRQGSVGPPQLEQLVRCASRLVLRQAIELTYDHPSVVAASKFLWQLARRPTSLPSPNVHRPRESWATLIHLGARLHALLGGTAVRNATIAAADVNGGWLRAADAQRFLGATIPDNHMMLREVLSPREMVWMALVLLRTEAATGKIRELGSLRSDRPVEDTVDARFVDEWIQDTTMMTDRRNQAYREYLEGLVSEAIGRVTGPTRLRPDVLFGLCKLVIRSGHYDLLEQMMKVLSEFRAVATRPHLRSGFLQLVPAGVLESKPALLRLVLVVIRRALWRPVPENAPPIPNPVIELERVLGEISDGLLALASVRDVFVEAGISTETVEARMGAPGRTTAIVNSQRFNRHCRRLLTAAAGGDVPTLDTDEQLVLCATDTDIPAARLFQYRYTMRDLAHTMFASPHNAVRIWFTQTSMSPLIVHRIDFADGTSWARDPHSPSARWPQQHEASMRAWRAQVLTARAASGGVAVGGGGAASGAVTTTIDETELSTIIGTVRDLLGQLPTAPDVGAWDA